MLQLPELKIGVDTKELETVITTLTNVKGAVDNLGKSATATNTKLNKTSDSLEKVTESSSKAVEKLQELGQAGLTAAGGIGATAVEAKQVRTGLDGIGAGGERATGGLSAVERKLQQTALKMQYLRGETINLRNGFEDAERGAVSLGKGFTSGQSGQLANLQMLGATAEQIRALAKEYTNFNANTSANKFDDSISGFIKMQKEVKELSGITDLMNQNLRLTREEYKFLARDIEATKQAFASQGKTVSEADAEIAKLKQSYIGLSQERHKLVAESKAMEQALKNEANTSASKNQEKAAKDVAAAFDKARNALEGLHNSVNQTDSNKIYALEQALKKTGLTAGEQFMKLEAFKDVLSQINTQKQINLETSKSEESVKRLKGEIFELQGVLSRIGTSTAVSDSDKIARFTSELEKTKLPLEERNRLLEQYRGLLGSIAAAESATKGNEVLAKLNQEIATLRTSIASVNANKITVTDDARIEAFRNSLKQTNLTIDEQKAKLNELKAALSGLREAEAKKLVSDNEGKQLAKLEAEMRRAQNALAGFNEELRVSSSNRILAFENGLKSSGLAIEEQTRRLNAYKKVIQDTQAAEAERSRKQLVEDTKHIQRAIAPQMTDIMVSLYSGQSPLTVLLQQGGQLTDQFTMAGIKAEQMGEIMRKSLYGIAPMYLGVGKAIVRTVVGAFVDAGKAVLNYTNLLTGLTALQEATLAASVTRQGTIIGSLAGAMNRAITAMSGVLTAFSATLIGGTVAGVIALGVAFYKTIKEENDLIRATNLTGASLGLTRDTTIGFANSLQTVQGTTTDTIRVITEMAKVGGFAKDQIELVRNAAVAMSEATGKSFEETTKGFAELAKKPTEGLIEFAKQTGMVRTETIALVAELEKQGKKSEAASVAMKAYGEASVAAANRIHNQYGTLTKIGIQLGIVFDKMWDKILGAGRAETASEVVARLSGELQNTPEKRQSNRNLSGWQTNSSNIIADRDQQLKKDALASANRALLNQTEDSIEKQRLSNAAKAQESFIELRKKHQSSLDSLEKESISKQAYVNKEKAKLDKMRNEGAVISEKEYKAILDSTAKDWEKAQEKPKKDKTEDFFATSLKSLKNESNQATKELDNLAQSQKKFLDIVNDPKFYAKGKDKERMLLAEAVEMSAANELRARSSNALQTAMKELEAVERKSVSTLEDYSESQKAMLKIFDSKAFTEMTDAAKQEVVAKFELIHANEQLATSEKKRQDLLKDYLSDLDKAQDFSRNYTKRVKEIDEAYVDGIITFKEYTEQLNALGRTQKGVINANKAIEEHKKLMAGLNAEIQALEDQADAYDKTSVAKKRYLEETKARKKYAEELSGAGDNEKRQAEALERFQARMKVAALRAENEITEEWTKGIGDAITTAIFEGGSAGGKKLRSFLVAELRKQISLQINVLIQPFVQGFTQALGLTGSGTQGGSIGNFLSNGVAGAIQSGFENLAHTTIGQKIGLSEVVLEEGGVTTTALTDIGSKISSAAGMLGNAMLGFSVSNLISNGYGSKTVSAIGGIASAFLGPIAGVVAGLVNRLFGRKLKDTGIQGTFDSKTGFQGESYKFYKGGLLRSDKTVTSALDTKTTSDFTLQFQQIKQSVSGLVSALGLTAPALETFTKDIKLSFQGLTDEQIKQKITDTFTEITDDLVKSAFTTKEETTRTVSEMQSVTSGFGDDQITTYQEVQKSVTDTTYKMREDIPQWVKAVLDAKGYTKEALDIIVEMPDKILSSLGTSSSELSNIIILGMQNNDAEGAGAAFAETITWGIRNSLQQSFAQQITGIVTTQMVVPIVTALTNGATITQAIAMVNINTMKKMLKDTVDAYKAIFSDPEVTGYLAEIGTFISTNVSGAMQGLNTTFQTAPQSYADVIAERNKAEKEKSEVDKAAKELEDQAKKVAEEKLGLERKLLELEGNTVALRKLDLEKIDASNRSLQERIWLLEDEKALMDTVRSSIERFVSGSELKNFKFSDIANKINKDFGSSFNSQNLQNLSSKEIKDFVKEFVALNSETMPLMTEKVIKYGVELLDVVEQVETEKKGLERQLLDLQEDTVAIRKLELETIDPSNRALQERIWLLEDEKKISEERKSLESKLLELQENTAELRRLELEKLDPSNRALQERIWLLEDEKKALERFVSAFDAVAKELMTPLQYQMYGYQKVANDLAKVNLKVDPNALKNLSRKEIIALTNEFVHMTNASTNTKAAVLEAANALLQLDDAANAVILSNLDALKANADRDLEKATSATDKAVAVVEKSIQKMRDDAEKLKQKLEDDLKLQEKQLKKYEDLLSKQEESFNKIKELFDYLKETTRELYGEVDSTRIVQVEIDKKFIADAIVSARNGTLPDFERLQEAVSSVRDNFSKTIYVSKFQADRDRLLLANDLRDLQDITGENLTEAEKLVINTKKLITLTEEDIEKTKKLVDLADDSIDKFDKQLQLLKDQIDIMRGTYIETMNVTDAIDGLKSAIMTEMQVRNLAQGIDATAPLPQGYSGVKSIYGANGAIYDPVTGYGKTSGNQVFNSKDLLAEARLHLQNGGDPRVMYNNVLNSGFTVEQMAKIVGISVEEILSWANMKPKDVQQVVTPTPIAPVTPIAPRQDLITEAQRILAERGPQGLYDAIKNTGMTIADANQYLGLSAGTLEDEARKLGLPIFDVGTNYVPSDTLAFVHKGEAVVPERFNPYNDNNSSGDSEDMKNLRVEVRAVVTHVAKLSRNIDRLIVPTTNGDALQTKAVV